MKKNLFASADIESNNWIEFLMIGFYDGKTYTKFVDLDLFLDTVLSKKYDGYRIYFHNGGRFDFLFLIERLLDRGVVKFINKSSGILGLVFSSNRFRVEFFDSYPLLLSSLDSLIKTYDISHKKIPIDFSIKRKNTDKKLSEHLKNDCIALYDILKMFLEREGYLSATVGSHAMRKFRENFFGGDFWSVNDNFDFYFRTNYYKGGRVEVYKGFGKNLYYYDVNSLYPFVMLEKMPVGMPKKTIKYMKGKIGFYKIKLLENTNEKISILCKRNKTGNYYCNGLKNETYFLISCELDELMKKYKIKIIDGYYFENAEYLFNDYVEHYYKIKENAKDEAEKYQAKMMLNNLYGKFGQQLYGQEIQPDTGQGDYPAFDVANSLLLVDVKRKIKFKGVYLAAYITALARMYHYNLMKKIGFDNIYYCDTDSIITNKQIKTGTKIGELKLEHKIKEGVFLMPKTYGFINSEKKEITHFKGFSKNVFSYKELKSVASNKTKELIQKSERILGFRESQSRKNKIKKSAGNYLKLVNQEKKLEFNYTRRKIILNKEHYFITECLKSDEISN